MALSLDDLQIEIQDLVARVARLEATYRAGGIATGGRDNTRQSQEAGGDRHNLARAVLGCLQRVDALEAEIRSLRGEEP